MNTIRRFGENKFVAFVTAMALALTFILGTCTASASLDRTKPTAPKNFRITARTSYSVSLTWSPSTDNSGNFTYRLWSTAGGASGATVTLPKTATSFTWNTGIFPRNTYTFGLYAVDAAGNTSAQASVTIITPPDRTPPSTAPVLTVTDVGSTFVSLSWTPTQDDAPFLFYGVSVNGSPHASAGTNTSATIHFLQPETTYSIQVRAGDYGDNLSPLSAPVTVTTEANNIDDTTPPTMPDNLTDNGMAFPDGETWLLWEESTDDVDPQSIIRYDVYANGVFNHSLVGFNRTILYGDPGYLNTFQVIAVDTAGNQSEPATLVTAP
jgi:chitinase